MYIRRHIQHTMYAYVLVLAITGRYVVGKKYHSIILLRITVTIYCRFTATTVPHTHGPNNILHEVTDYKNYHLPYKYIGT